MPIASSRDLREQGRRGGLARWRGRSQSEKNAASAAARAALSQRYQDQATAAFARLGVEPTLEQVEAGAKALHRSDLSARLTAARVKAAEAKERAKRKRDTEDAARQVAAHAAVLRVNAPGMPDHVVSGLCIRAAEEELGAPDGYHAERLARRLGLVVRDWRGMAPPI